MHGGIRRNYRPPSPEPGTKASPAPEQPHPPERSARGSPRSPPAGAAANRDAPWSCPPGAASCPAERVGARMHKSQTAELGGGFGLRGDRLPSRLALRSNPCSEQAPHFPASACSRAFFLFLKCPKPRESQEAYASSIVIILQERSGQGS